MSIEFRTITRKYTEGQIVPVSDLRLGMSFKITGDKEEGRQLLDRVTGLVGEGVTVTVYERVGTFRRSPRFEGLSQHNKYVHCVWGGILIGVILTLGIGILFI